VGDFADADEEEESELVVFEVLSGVSCFEEECQRRRWENE
jgi:hypothetical protein